MNELTENLEPKIASLPIDFINTLRENDSLIHFMKRTYSPSRKKGLAKQDLEKKCLLKVVELFSLEEGNVVENPWFLNQVEKEDNIQR